MGASASVWEEIKHKTNAKGGNPASPRNPKTSVRQAASRTGDSHPRLAWPPDECRQLSGVALAGMQRLRVKARHSRIVSKMLRMRNRRGQVCTKSNDYPSSNRMR